MTFPVLVDACVLVPVATTDLLMRMANAELLVTANSRDFPVSSVASYDIDVRTPDDFLLDQLDLHPHGVIQITFDIVARLQKPPVTWDQYVESLQDGLSLPLFATELRRLVSAQG